MRLRNGRKSVEVIHADDCLITGSSPELIADYKHKLNQRDSLRTLAAFTGYLIVQMEIKSYKIMCRVTC